MPPSDLKGYRKQRQLTQAALATMLGVATNTVARWERGKLATPAWLDRFLAAEQAAQDAVARLQWTPWTRRSAPPRILQVLFGRDSAVYARRHMFDLLNHLAQAHTCQSTIRMSVSRIQAARKEVENAGPTGKTTAWRNPDCDSARIQ